MTAPSLKPAFAVVVLWMGACEPMRGPSRIHFTVPTGFRGVFSIAAVPGGKVPPVVGGVVQITVPTTAIVMVSDDEFLERIGAMSATYSDGAVLQTQMMQPLPPFSGRVSLYLATVSSRGTYYFFVGTDQEMSDLYVSRKFEVGSTTE